MSLRGKLSLAAIAVVTSCSAAHANDPRCNRPPYGGSPDRYRAFVETYGKSLDNPATTLAAMCNMKFGGADRTTLYNLGFTDGQIDRQDTSELAIDMLSAVRGRQK